MAAGFKTATVNASDVPATLTNYPAYVDLSRLGITTLAEAQSVRVYADSAKTTEWAREIVSASEMWVKIPSLTSSTAIYVDWDGTSSDYTVTDTYGRNAVWSDYILVFHLSESSGNIVDSTGNGNDATVVGTPTYSVSSAIGNGIDFDATSDYFSSIPSSALDATSPYSLQGWADMDGDSDSAIIAFGNTSNIYPNALLGGFGGSNRVGMFIRNNATVGSNAIATVAKTSRNLYHGVRRTSGNTTELYVNGSSVATNGTTVSGAITFNTGAVHALIRSTVSYTGPSVLDEIRARQSVLSADWITTEYNNQSDESGFWGTWTDAGGGATRRVFNIS